jgi:UDP-glucose 4-epimerase
MQRDGNAVLVTGGAGFIGSHLVERLVKEGLEVRVLDDFSSGRPENLREVCSQITVHEGSILDRSLLARAAEGCSCIFHLAAVVSVPLSIERPDYVNEVNGTGTFAVVEAARTHGSRVVFSSSAAVYGEVSCPVQSEDEPLDPISPYGVQKSIGELYLRSYHRVHGLEAFALRYFNVYGPRQDAGSPYSGVISIFLDRARKGEDLVIFGNGAQTRDYVHVDDVVQANFAAMRAHHADGAALNVGTGKPTDLNTLARSILRSHGDRGKIQYREPRNGDIPHSCAHPERARARLAFTAKTDIHQGLNSLIASGILGE